MLVPYSFTRIARAGVAILALSACARAPAAAQTGAARPDTVAASQPAANPVDVASADAIIASLYDVISGPAGQKRNWDRMRSLFAPGARLIFARVKPDGAAQPIMLDVAGYIERAGPSLERDGFFEREIFHKVESFGNIVHRFSTYESRRKADDTTPFARGINSIQLLKDGNRWWVITIYWDSERAGNQIPAEYLPRQ